MKGGEKRRVLKCLQVDLSFKKAFNGRNESKCSNTSSMFTVVSLKKKKKRVLGFLFIRKNG